MLEMESTDEPDLWITLNGKFHECIYAAASRPRLLTLIDQLRNTSAPYIRQFITTSGYILEAAADHRAIFHACVNHDEADAERLTQEHLLAVCAGVVNSNKLQKAEQNKDAVPAL